MHGDLTKRGLLTLVELCLLGDTIRFRAAFGLHLRHNRAGFVIMHDPAGQRSKPDEILSVTPVCDQPRVNERVEADELPNRSVVCVVRRIMKEREVAVDRDWLEIRRAHTRFRRHLLAAELI